MSDHNNQNPVTEHIALRCVGCGKPTTSNHYCRECVDRGLGPCEACEGLSLLDVEEDEQ